MANQISNQISSLPVDSIGNSARLSIGKLNPATSWPRPLFSKDTDWFGHILTDQKEIRWEFFKIDR